LEEIQKNLAPLVDIRRHRYQNIARLDQFRANSGPMPVLEISISPRTPRADNRLLEPGEGAALIQTIRSSLIWLTEFGHMGATFTFVN
jgi:hypothetical protein